MHALLRHIFFGEFVAVEVVAESDKRKDSILKKHVGMELSGDCRAQCYMVWCSMGIC